MVARGRRFDLAASAPFNPRPMSIRLNNHAARRLFLERHGLAGERRPDLLSEIERLGFVQVDSVNTVERAHHMILAARRKSYRPQHLKTLLERRRGLFEHWTHDASVIPMAYFPYWRRRFERDRTRLLERWRLYRREGFDAHFESVLAHVRDTGPVMAREVGEGAPSSNAKGAGWWDWRPEKTALEFLWRTGALAVSGRVGFQKIFDLTERVVPDDILHARMSPEEGLEWAGGGAIDRLGFATSGEVAAFWETLSAAEAKAWCADRVGRDLIEIEVEGADGRVRTAYARPDVEAAAASTPPPTAGVRILSPFDPALRDRKRAEWLFGFRYRIEIYTPAAKRRYGYYVFPVLEGARLIGRIDMRRAGSGGTLAVRAFWPEHGVRMGKGRLDRLERELDRMAKFAGASCVSFENDWLRTAP